MWMRWVSEFSRPRRRDILRERCWNAALLLEGERRVTDEAEQVQASVVAHGKEGQAGVSGDDPKALPSKRNRRLAPVHLKKAEAAILARREDEIVLGMENGARYV